jgi:hypothetical protein
LSDEVAHAHRASCADIGERDGHRGRTGVEIEQADNDTSIALLSKKNLSAMFIGILESGLLAAPETRSCVPEKVSPLLPSQGFIGDGSCADRVGTHLQLLVKDSLHF